MENEETQDNPEIEIEQAETVEEVNGDRHISLDDSATANDSFGG